MGKLQTVSDTWYGHNSSLTLFIIPVSFVVVIELAFEGVQFSGCKISRTLFLTRVSPAFLPDGSGC
jgi:hypothetical protein